MAAFVVDASATLPWCFADEATATTNALLTPLQTGDEALVPAHWPAEVANALLIAVRHGRISSRDADQFLEDLDVLAIRIDTATQKLIRLHILPIAEKHSLTIYDAAYLELAMRRAVPLATLDDDLRKAARISAVLLEL
ncbi:MAG TPA: type II toxin-antitoxin system VapC family toxin [Terriglobia bacterium]|nr:type II toxin-antitoxin system VapC family toxin [Terriglobia bacterium]